MDQNNLRLLKVMREQLGETPARRTVDAVAAANSLGMNPGEPRARPALFGSGRIHRGVRRELAMTTLGMYLIIFQGTAAIENA